METSLCATPAQPADDWPRAVLVPADDLAAILAFVNKAEPILDELAEHLPKLRELAPLLAQVSQGGIGGLAGLLGGILRGGQ